MERSRGRAHAHLHGGVVEGRVAVGFAHGAALAVGRVGRCGRRPRPAHRRKRQLAHAADASARAARNIVWTTSNENVIDVDGTVTRPNVGEGDQVVMLTAYLKFNGQTTSRSFQVAVPQRQPFNRVAHLRFRESLIESLGRFGAGQATGNRIWNAGTVGFDVGHDGSALRLNGSNGVRLPAGPHHQLRIHGLVLDQSDGHHALHAGASSRR